MTPGHGTPRERRGRLASSPAVRTRDRRRAFRTAAASAALVVAAACSSGGGNDGYATPTTDKRPSTNAAAGRHEPALRRADGTFRSTTTFDPISLHSKDARFMAFASS